MTIALKGRHVKAFAGFPGSAALPHTWIENDPSGAIEKSTQRWPYMHRLPKNHYSNSIPVGVIVDNNGDCQFKSTLGEEMEREENENLSHSAWPTRDNDDDILA